MRDEFKMLDKPKTCQAVKDELSEYHDWRLKAKRFTIDIQSPSWDFAPKSPSYENHNEEKLVEEANAKYECALRMNTLKAMRGVGPQEEIYADLLQDRYIYGYSPIETSNHLTEKYKEFVPERTFYKLQTRALLTFAEIYPRDTVRIKKVGSKRAVNGQ